MSTFKGVMPEFPSIRVDFFRRVPDYPPPVACFLSHVHSDHLAGLETFNGSFIYCSAATKEILLRLEKSAVRLNYARGILEDPGLQTYKHLEKHLKPLPLDTPAVIELYPGHSIRVTLFDANHCVGGVMFLFEGDGKAVLYTGDIRCEPRFVASISQNPNMIEYSSGAKTLDRIYLDTSVLDDFPLQTKAEGLRELLRKVQDYPKDTIFHFQAWTYGYEEVWIALSKALGSKIHVDEYKFRVFDSLAIKSKDNRWAIQTHLSKEAPALVGFTCGNTQQEGCLTRDETVRIHSCEKGTPCSVIETKPSVRICPIVSHLRDGRDMLEVGVGGGGEDLTHTTTLTAQDIEGVLQMIPTDEKHLPELQPYINMMSKSLRSGRDINLLIDPAGNSDTEETVQTLLKSLFRKVETMQNPIRSNAPPTTRTSLPEVIHFPYARHSSLPELRDFVGVFRPRDIVPCTFDETGWLEKGWSIATLFGDCCSGDAYASEHEYDAILHQTAEELEAMRRRNEDSQQTAASSSSPALGDAEMPDVVLDPPAAGAFPEAAGLQGSCRGDEDQSPWSEDVASEPDLQGDSQGSAISERTYAARRKAFDIACANLVGESWETIGLISTTDNHTRLEEELGH
ncbi:hypothetical protein GGR50DRAFT_650544 [Xylaria sp. CBS 124048]|nr:hypothetical protein GGR50DRAFT_650544 [Xylaria sp. CBS 124048]